jgi:excinuclease ABC subunit B
VTYDKKKQLDALLAQTKKGMEKAARELDFMEAARLRDKLFLLQKEKEAMK